MERAKSIVFPLITLAVILAAWQFSVTWLQVPDYLLPTPRAVWNALYLAYVEGTFWPHFFFTLQATSIGYLLGCSAGLVMGALLAESRTFEQFVYPYIIALQSMPKVALAPLIIVWLGFDLASKVVMVALVCFFPVFVNTVVGIRQTSPALLDLMKVFSGSRTRTFFRVKLPAAASHIFAGLQVAIVLSLIGAVVAEFVASSKGLGYLIKAASVSFETNIMFAALLSLALIGVLASHLVRLLHHFVVFWDRNAGSGSVMAE